MCSDNEGEIVDLAGVNSAAAELDAAQVAHDLDELIMEDDESVEEETPLEGSQTFHLSIYPSQTSCYHLIR